MSPAPQDRNTTHCRKTEGPRPGAPSGPPARRPRHDAMHDQAQHPKTYVILPQFQAGALSVEDLERLAALARKYEVPLTKITGAQRIAFLGLSEEQAVRLGRELGLPETPPHKRRRVHYIQACPGSRWCKYGVRDALAMGRAIGDLELDGPLPYKVKVGVSGCRMCCCESWIRDVGLIGERRGWRFVFGGNGAGRPRIGDVVAKDLSDDEAVELVRRTLNYYIATAKYKTRSARYMERFGIEALKRGVLDG